MVLMASRNECFVRKSFLEIASLVFYLSSNQANFWEQKSRNKAERKISSVSFLPNLSGALLRREIWLHGFHAWTHRGMGWDGLPYHQLTKPETPLFSASLSEQHARLEIAPFLIWWYNGEGEGVGWMAASQSSSGWWKKTMQSRCFLSSGRQ